MFIDTHCHLTDKYTDGADAIIARAADAGVGAIVCATAEPDDFAPVIALCEKHPNIFATIGVHPEHIGALPDYENLLTHPRVIGVGEIGLDYHYGAENKNAQIELFQQQIEIARTAGLPIAVHTRDAEDDTYEILKDFSIAPPTANAEPPLSGGAQGVMHCFTGSWDFAKKMLDRGFYFSASGIITFKNSVDLREVFAKIPTDRIVIETDAPYCAPVPYRGKTAEPAMVVETARILSEIKHIEFSELETILEKNTKTLYPKLCAL
jgi:TatD DNase family protein